MGALMYVVDLANGLGRLGLNLGTNFIILEWMVISITFTHNDLYFLLKN